MKAFKGTHARRRALRYVVAPVLLVAAALLLVAAPPMAQADFSGAFAPSNWTASPLPAATDGDTTGVGLLQTSVTNGEVVTANAPAAITLVGVNSFAAPGDIPLPAPGGADIDFVTTLTQAGSLSFNFAWDLLDISPGFDTGGFLLDGVYTALADGGDESGSSGLINVLAGQVFGFRVNTVDQCCGAGVFTVSNFTFTPDDGGVVTPPNGETPSVPEPGMLILMGLGAAGFALRRLGRRAK